MRAGYTILRLSTSNLVQYLRLHTCSSYFFHCRYLYRRYKCSNLAEIKLYFSTIPFQRATDTRRASFIDNERLSYHHRLRTVADIRSCKVPPLSQNSKMHSSYLLPILTTFLSLTTANPAPISNTPSTEVSSIQKRGANWCTLHYVQSNEGPSKLWVYGPNTSTDPNAAAPPLGIFQYNEGGAFTPLPGYGDWLVAINNLDQSVTFMRQGTVSKDSWTVKKADSGTVGSCGVGAWNYGVSRTMDCGFTCVPYNGP